MCPSSKRARNLFHAVSRCTTPQGRFGSSRDGMNKLSSKLLDLLWHDAEPRELELRRIITERLAADPAPILLDSIVATYFFALRSSNLSEAVHEIAYHATSGVKNPPARSLLEACTAKAAGIDPFDTTCRLG